MIVLNAQASEVLAALAKVFDNYNDEDKKKEIKKVQLYSDSMLWGVLI